MAAGGIFRVDPPLPPTAPHAPLATPGDQPPAPVGGSGGGDWSSPQSLLLRGTVGAWMGGTAGSQPPAVARRLVIDRILDAWAPGPWRSQRVRTLPIATAASASPPPLGDPVRRIGATIVQAWVPPLPIVPRAGIRLPTTDPAQPRYEEQTRRRLTSLQWLWVAPPRPAQELEGVAAFTVDQTPVLAEQTRRVRSQIDAWYTSLRTGIPLAVRTVPRITSDASIADGGEAGSAIAGQIESVASVAIGGEAGAAITGQEQDDAHVLGGGEAGADILAQITSVGTVAVGGEAGSEASDQVQSVGVVHGGGEAGGEILSALPPEPSFGGGRPTVERQLDAREWLGAVLGPPPAPLLITESDAKPKPRPLHDATLRVPRVRVLEEIEPALPPLVCVVTASAESGASLRAQIASMGHIGASGASRTALVGDVSGDDLELQNVLRMIAELDDVLDS